MKRLVKKRKLVRESYDVSDELAKKLNSVLADEYLASVFYRLAQVAMKGQKQHLLTDIAKKNGEDELEDHFKNLSEWMQSKGIKVVTNYDEMLDLTNGTVFTVEDGDSTEDIVDKLIKSEEEAIETYENLIPDTDLDLHSMLCGFLKDEREHLKELKDAKDEMQLSSSDKKKKPTIYENIRRRKPVKGKNNRYRVYDVYWDTEDERDFEQCDEILNSDGNDIVEVPSDITDPDEIEQYISDYISDLTGYCHNGFNFEEV